MIGRVLAAARSDTTMPKRLGISWTNRKATGEVASTVLR
jgi:hypothetical protein